MGRVSPRRTSAGRTSAGRTFAGEPQRRADLRRADLTGADLSGADLSGGEPQWGGPRRGEPPRGGLQPRRISAGRTSAGQLRFQLIWNRPSLQDAKVYGVSVWDVKLQKSVQTSLVITNEQPDITVDNLEVAQFIYLLLNNSKIRNVIDTITSKAVLILGRFTPERKATLDALRDALRSHNYLPILFDFEKPTNRDFTETVSTLAHLARFVIADLVANTPDEVAKMAKRLSRHGELDFCYEAGGCGYGIYRQLTALGHKCTERLQPQ